VIGDNNLTLAVAGSRKTQGIVDAVAALPVDERVLILTYTTVNQDELRRRIRAKAGRHTNVEIMGWFSFLITHFVRPFLPFAFPGRRVHGFDFESPPQTYSTADSYDRYFNGDGQVRRVHLAQIALRVNEASDGAPISRLQRMHDRIFIDEVQDLCGYDLEVLTLLLESTIPIEMVGDVRQAVIATNERERKNKKFMYMGIWNWFLAQEIAGRLAISIRNETWRCHPAIAAFADSLFDASWGFEPTVSLNDVATDHDGVFLIRETEVPEYVAAHSPLCLRYSAASAKDQPYAFMNFRLSKGLTRERVLVWPTSAIKKMLTDGTRLELKAAAALYVAVTRAEQSVAFVLDTPGDCSFSYWTPRGR
jgi:hypothetical protein